MLRVKKSNLLLAALVAALISSTVPANAAAGIISIALTAAQSNAMKYGRYLYDVEMTSSGGAKTRVLEGQVEITPGVTQI